ncbi:hypothetical protein ROJ8625_02567 [Roseivivax jejudonensis]|uniref:Uncharacterized protein n=1 Tax=Roseivivax jejudonensis TaxID=1529041 RepID=A0A1X6ZH39_9RHOB|nr:YeeE/YedE family protein [Roseivivax jejudonensis]SLN51473.1 hypothetical protein ROJ8625_02567 [Roseivivax jejudonensis]
MELDTATAFTPLASLAGGVLIGLSAVMVMALFGRIAGISGITRGVMGALTPGAAGIGDAGWRIGFVLGLIAAPLAVATATGALPRQTVPDALPGMAIAGLVVGVGTALGSGCTSGHGVCGLARLSPRSFAAVGTFMAAAFATVFILRHLV